MTAILSALRTLPTAALRGVDPATDEAMKHSYRERETAENATEER
jgi:hypothetical protein